jgi:hypothetical protein
MMISYIFTFLFSFSTLADSQLALCEKEAHKFGSGLGQDKIPADCIEHIEKIADQRHRTISKDKRVSIYGLRNMIVIKDPTSRIKGQNVIAGKYTELEDIKEILLDEKNDEIVVLEDSGDVLFFSKIVTGNVAPKRILRHESLESVTAIRLYQDEIFALDSQNNELLIFSRDANIHALEGKKNLSPLRRTQGVKGEELVLDETGRKLLVVSKNSKLIFDLEKKSTRKPASAE